MARRRRHLAKRLARLTAQDFRDFARAQAAVLAAHWLVWRRPTGRLLARGPATQQMPQRSMPIPTEVERLLRAVNRAAVYGVTRPLCLTRAVALMRLLDADGHKGGVLRIGVRWEGGAFIAHAWVEFHGSVLDLDPSLHRPFTRIADTRVASVEQVS
jgi:hypothetical protein